MLCYDSEQQRLHGLFGVSLTYGKSDGKGEIVKKVFLDTINQYKRQIEAINIVVDLFNQI